MTSPAHSEFPASGAKRLIECPGSFRLTRELRAKGIPDRPPSSYAAQGTAAHHLAEELLAHRGDPVGQAAIAADVLDWPAKIDQLEITFDQEMVDHVQTYVSYIETLEAFDYDLKFEQRVSPTLPWTVRSEKPPVNLFGTADCYGVRRYKDDIVVVDLKFGAGIKVDVTENPQLLYYALGVVSELAEAEPKSPPVSGTPVELVVIQPRTSGGHEPKIFNTSVRDVVVWGEAVFRPAVERVLKPNARLNPGEWCQFCPAYAYCPEIDRLAKAKVKELFDDHAFEDNPATALAVLSERALADDLLLAATLEPWIDALREEAVRRLSNGIAVPWHKLVQKRAIRKWTDEQAAVTTAADAGYDITEVIALSPARAEKIAPRVDFEPFYEKKSSGVTVAHDSDPRPAVVAAKTVFNSDQQKRITNQ